MKQRCYFGTDGVRGAANTEPMTAATVLRLGAAAGNLFTRGTHRHSVVIGKDTRLSGYMVESALTAGFVSVGMDVLLVGPMPTPAVAMLTRSLRADLGIMISASHNPYEDNGIKIFGPDGYKLSDEMEASIESAMDQFGDAQGGLKCCRLPINLVGCDVLMTLLVDILRQPNGLFRVVFAWTVLRLLLTVQMGRPIGQLPQFCGSLVPKLYL